jgi:hypothetical protein
VAGVTSRREIERWGEHALQQVRGPVWQTVRRRVAAWRDPRARLLRRRRRAGRFSAGGAVSTGVLGGGSYLAWSEAFAPGADAFGLEVVGGGLGGLTAAFAVGTVSALVRYRQLRSTPLPDPAPEPVQLPPSESRAHGPMRQLRDAELSLHTILGQLRAGGGIPEESVVSSRATADETARALRQVAERLRAVEGALPHVAAVDRAALRAEVSGMAAHLDEGVEGYRGLVAAAGKAVAATALPEKRELVQDATDHLAGVAQALRELSGPSAQK